MADFLSKLAARAIGAAPLAQPVIAAAFATAQLAEAQPISTELPEISSDDVEPEPELPVRVAEAQAAHPRKPSEPQHGPPLAKSIPVQADVSAETSEAEIPAAPLSFPPQLSGAPQGRRTTVAAAPGGSRRTAARKHGQHISMGDAPSIPPPAQRALTPEVAQVPAIPREQGGAHEAASPIRISIGRVEVRAVLPPNSAPPRAPERQKGILTLEEYTRQRSRGER